MSVAKKLVAYLAEAGARPFDWGAFNCCHLAAGWVEVCAGAHPMAGLPATPTERAARRLIRALGGTLADAWTRQLGRDPISPAMAQLGDVVLLDVDGRPVIGICNGMTAVAPLDVGGTTFVPMALATHAWRLAC